MIICYNIIITQYITFWRVITIKTHITHLAIVSKDFEITLINGTNHRFSIGAKLIVLLRIGKDYVVLTENGKHSFILSYKLVDSHTQKYNEEKLYKIHNEYSELELIKVVPKQQLIEKSKNKLRYLMENNKHMTLNKIADRLAVNRQQVYQWKSGISKIPSKYYKSLSQIFDVDEDYFILEDD